AADTRYGPIGRTEPLYAPKSRQAAPWGGLSQSTWFRVGSVRGDALGVVGCGRTDRIVVRLVLPLDRRQRLGQSTCQDLVDGHDRDDLQSLLHVVGDLGEILLVLLRDQHGLQATAQGGQQLLLQAADRQHAAAQA